MSAMEKAVEEILNKTMIYREAQVTYEVPKSTLEKMVSQIEKYIILIIHSNNLFVILIQNLKNKNEVLKPKLGSIITVFTADKENELVSFLNMKESRLFGLSSED